VVYKTDNSLGMERIEPFAEDAMGIGHLWWWTCATGKRYCMNSHLTLYQIPNKMKKVLLLCLIPLLVYLHKTNKQPNFETITLAEVVIGVLRPFMKI
jgi:hypothetical protein